jgi:hypothetical protein
MAPKNLPHKDFDSRVLHRCSQQGLESRSGRPLQIGHGRWKILEGERCHDTLSKNPNIYCNRVACNSFHATHSMLGFTVDERFVIMKCFKCYFGPHRQAPDGKREKCPREGNNTVHCLQMIFLINKCCTTIAWRKLFFVGDGRRQRKIQTMGVSIKEYQQKPQLLRKI